MRVPISWLSDYVAPELNAHDLAERLALTGTEVERVEHHGVDALEQFVVGKVLERRRHPDADRLSVCMVDTGGSTPSQIVCGAPNVAAGQIVAVAKPGAIMPDGTRLNKARLRGVESNGMILAEDELALGTDHAETLVLASDFCDCCKAAAAELTLFWAVTAADCRLAVSESSAFCDVFSEFWAVSSELLDVLTEAAF